MRVGLLDDPEDLVDHRFAGGGVGLERRPPKVGVLLRYSSYLHQRHGGVVLHLVGAFLQEDGETE